MMKSAQEPTEDTSEKSLKESLCLHQANEAIEVSETSLIGSEVISEIQAWEVIGNFTESEKPKNKICSLFEQEDTDIQVDYKLHLMGQTHLTSQEQEVSSNIHKFPQISLS